MIIEYILLGALLSILSNSIGYCGDSRDTMRCNNAVISIGSTAGEVVNKCGAPASGAQSQIVTINGNRINQVMVSAGVDDWIYNFGPNQFQYQVTLKNGRVKRIQSLSYGY